MKITSVTTKSNYVLQLTFSDGKYGEISIKNRLFGPMFEPLKDPVFFAQVKIDQFGAIYWPNQADLAPDSLYLNIINKKNT